MKFKKSLCLSFLLSLSSFAAIASPCLLNMDRVENFTLTPSYGTTMFSYSFEVPHSRREERGLVFMECLKESSEIYIGLHSTFEILGAISSNHTIRVGTQENPQSEGVIETGDKEIRLNGASIQTECRLYASDGTTLLAYCAKGLKGSDFEFINLDGTKITSLHKNSEAYSLELSPDSHLCEALPLVYAASKLTNLTCVFPPQPSQFKQIFFPTFAAVLIAIPVGLAYWLYKRSSFQPAPDLNSVQGPDSTQYGTFEGAKR